MFKEKLFKKFGKKFENQTADSREDESFIGKNEKIDNAKNAIDNAIEKMLNKFNQNI